MNIPILMYHSIVDDSYQSVSINSFKKQMIFMKKMGYQTISFKDLNKKNHNKEFILTFDDGYENIFTNAFPILIELGFKATCFIITNKIGHYNEWDINKDNFKKMKLMNRDQINEWLQKGFDVGSHTMDHLDLIKLNYENKNQQIINSKKFFKDVFNIEIDSFAYPFGSYDNETLNIIKQNYNYAVTTKRSRFIKNKFSNELLPRVPINKNDSLFKFFLKIRTPYEDIKFKN
jgi:peptidoglycan/xylan/chitin deacetylase (PgdA/CDA1 family)